MSIAVHSPPLRPGCVAADAKRAGRCCKAAGRAADVGPWMQRSKVAGQMRTQLETSCFCLGCLICFPCAGILLEIEGLQGTRRDVMLLKCIKLLNVWFH